MTYDQYLRSKTQMNHAPLQFHNIHKSSGKRQYSNQMRKQMPWTRSHINLQDDDFLQPQDIILKRTIIKRSSPSNQYLNDQDQQLELKKHILRMQIKKKQLDDRLLPQIQNSDHRSVMKKRYVYLSPQSPFLKVRKILDQSDNNLNNSKALRKSYQIQIQNIPLIEPTTKKLQLPQISSLTPNNNIICNNNNKSNENLQNKVIQAQEHIKSRSLTPNKIKDPKNTIKKKKNFNLANSLRRSVFTQSKVVPKSRVYGSVNVSSKILKALQEAEVLSPRVTIHKERVQKL